MFPLYVSEPVKWVEYHVVSDGALTSVDWLEQKLAISEAVWLCVSTAPIHGRLKIKTIATISPFDFYFISVKKGIILFSFHFYDRCRHTMGTVGQKRHPRPVLNSRSNRQTNRYAFLTTRGCVIYFSNVANEVYYHPSPQPKKTFFVGYPKQQRTRRFFISPVMYFFSWKVEYVTPSVCVSKLIRKPFNRI